MILDGGDEGAKERMGEGVRNKRTLNRKSEETEGLKGKEAEERGAEGLRNGRAVRRGEVEGKERVRSAPGTRGTKAAAQ